MKDDDIEIKKINDEVKELLKNNPTPDDDTINYIIYKIFKKINDDINRGD